MKVEESIYVAKLFDAYGGMLSDGQQKILNYYLNYDYTITEIAEKLNVSRQAVLDSINKGGKKLRAYEEKLNLVKKMDQLIMQNQKFIAENQKLKVKLEKLSQKE